MSEYDKPPELYDGLRLHQNENTGGCSPRVLDALARLNATDIGFYPPYAAATRACASYLDVAPDRLALTNLCPRVTRTAAAGCGEAARSASVSGRSAATRPAGMPA